MAIKDLLELTVQRGASDLHIIAGLPPYLRVQGNLLAVKSEAIMTQDIIEKYLKEILNPENLERFGVNRELDFSLSFSAKSRFRVNAYTQRGSFAISFRNIPIEIPPIDELGLPKILHAFTTLRQGFVLVTGPTGHGKSTTIASMLNEINETRSCHIITIEDPIEFLFKPRNSIVSQREMGGDTHSWQIALRSVLREDPDVVLVGEMRDYETISAALTVAETGHLVFATLHTNSAAQTIDRIVDVFPDEQQKQVRLQLSNVVEAVFSMRLIPTVSGDRAVAYEVMLGTSAIKSSIREGKTHQIDNILQTSTEVGMNTIEMSLASLIKSGRITLETAQSFSLRPEELSRLMRSGR
ncbi:type IV pili twitching motility protein PilT [Candidatus Woesebacteria bacterium RIFCSPLOWO2_01_FULL_39_23]|uniref:Type IV pili twitching motility protein PilT n=1 Tax=Candidatus Woesebacteria bacterium RIFCSPHIGHO2_01_FULL_40_22 TaxID=1802499 RepID=A0A1F7YKD9_9BACT|nr:MAG: type IV pili twitching motility protein PilT [Candidatus Woesebacteria bacterium RBG_16_40_11]OGM27349.1 MAG: type IV pili twitching motility protein PilT [Candidatus Woesebacteria bacterium RIFCSPHIGHO2_01_FULL_40_22]OGM36954.1 MAG: type IV pili twitching motility protein PilT [Candidatus Woesebacteria bacterium RIFCSPHIGHO2_12_FULL_38_9]OGM62521.1 MAG: type IV pili twitching motility protein PilT [Candidatus Woesebacteria bacterium RIFCSPLOWO2_01_FULL_39_23]